MWRKKKNISKHSDVYAVNLKVMNWAMQNKRHNILSLLDLLFLVFIFRIGKNKYSCISNAEKMKKICDVKETRDNENVQ